KMAEKQEEPSDTQNGEPDTAGEGEEKKKKVKREDLPPFEIVTGERLPAIFFKFQFRNVEYSSGRNKTFLCYVLETQGKEAVTARGYLEDEHAAAHAEMAFFSRILPRCEPNLRYSLTWYVSSSPCGACAERIAETLRQNSNLRMALLVGRLFMWEQPEVQAALKKMKAAGCKLRIMKPQDFEYVWQNFVEQEEGEEAKAFVPWEDIQENFNYYQEKLEEIL
ncbi:ABEC2 enzyme, partial [Psilopogon haemacephalus]|nr:ABEC2 enzyme [Psilopogon haemacephalus]